MTTTLTYPPIAQPTIGDGSATAIADGVLWMRMPVEGRLGSVNCWALDDGSGWTIVDTGLRTPETANAWRKAFAGTLCGRPVLRVIVTHMHPDHSGMAGWIAQEQAAPLFMSRLEYLTLKVMAGYTGQEAPAESIQFYRAAGWGEDAIDRYRARFGRFGERLYPVPDQFHAVEHGDSIAIGERTWRVICGRGHSPEHLLLHSRDSGILLAGDQVLPEISSNVSLQPIEPAANPLADWLTSLARVRALVSDDVLVLPGHGAPFRGLHHRIDDLNSGHEASLARLAEHIAEPKRVIDVFPALFKRRIDPEVLGLATGESLAHLVCLERRGCAKRWRDQKGVDWWSASHPSDTR